MSARFAAHPPGGSIRPPGYLAVICAVVLTWGSTAFGQSPSPDPDPWFGPDKAMHFGAGFGLGVGGYTLGAVTLDQRIAAAALGLGLVAVLGGLKEGLDAAGLGEPSWRDFTWDLIGGGLGVGVSITFDAALRGPDDP